MEPDYVVHVVDDDTSVREALAWLLDSVGLTSTGYDSGRAFLDAVKPGAKGCAILDLRMPEMGGLDVQSELAKRGIDLPVIILTAHGDVPAAVRAMKAGAIDFVEKPFNNQLLIDTVLYAISRQGEKANGSDEAPHGEADVLRVLTPREKQVLGLLVAGHANKEVAAKLDISVKTAEYHRANIMKKTGATSLSDLVGKTANITLL